jgi:RNA polymerase sigma-70 factor (ECF subfamily)
VKSTSEGISTSSLGSGKTDVSSVNRSDRKGPMSTSQSDDHADVEGVFAGDRAAFGRIMRRHDAALRRLVFSIVRNASSVDDVLQDTYLKAFRSLGSYRPDRSFSAWLHRIAYTTALDALRASGRRSASSLDDERTPEPSSRDAEVSDRMGVAEALAKLPLKQRTAALLVDGHGYTYGEVATILEIPSGTVAFQLHLARKTLRGLLAGSEGNEQ